MPMDEGGPNRCLLRYRTTRNANGQVLFVCAHGGWDGTSMVRLPPGSQIWFFGSNQPNANTITAGRCYQIMRADTPISPSSIGGGQASIWNYSITEFPGDWQGAIEAVEHAKEAHGIANDCVMVSDDRRGTRTIRLSDVMAAFPGYHAYAWMACRVGH